MASLNSRLATWALSTAIVVGCCGYATPTHAIQNVNVLMMGDSITAGGYYITTLQSQLASSGIDSTVLGKCAVGGWYIGNLDANMGSYLSLPGVNQSNTYILLMVGTNNVGDSSMKDRAPADLGNLITKIKNTVPLANLVVSNLTPRLDYAADRIPVFNAAFSPIADSLMASGVDFTYVDMFTPMNVNPTYYLRTDGVHPNTEYGHPLMAGVWYDGIMATAAPEPGTLAMLSIGAIGLLIMLRRKRSA